MGFRPSGEQWRISHGDQAAVIVEVGGGIREYTLAGRHLLDGYGEDELCTVARGQVLIPWPNRLQDGAYRWEGEDAVLPWTEPARRNAIHGLVRWLPWQLQERSQSSLTVGCLLHPQPGYPHLLRLWAAYELSDRGLTVTLGGENAGPAALPYAAGQHPYLKLADAPLDQATLRVPAATRLLTDERGIPTGAAAVSEDFDFRAPRGLGATRLDTAYLDLERDEGGIARVEAEQDGRRLTLWLDAAFPYLMVFTGDTVPQPERRRRGLGLEPMTAAPNAFRSGEGLIRLEPGQSHSASWGLEPGS